MTMRADRYEQLWTVVVILVINWFCQFSSAQYDLTAGASHILSGQLPPQDVSPQVSWASWTPWSACSAKCGGGLEKRVRFCPRQAEHRVGCYGAGVQVRRCALQPCFGLGLLDSWSVWTQWSSCCGHKRQLRTRVCRTRHIDGQRSRCYGTGLEVRKCHAEACNAVEVTAFFNMQSVRGNITFRQVSHGSPVLISVRLNGITELPRLGWHVHEFPVPYDIVQSSRCSEKAVGSHFDPFQKALLLDYEMRCARNAADCEVGDLSGRHGSLGPVGDFEDRFLTLSGPNSIVGRSIVIHRADGSRWACASIGYPKADIITAVATFAGPVVAGKIVLRQPSDDPSAETSVMVDLGRADGQTSSRQHNWHVYTRPVPDTSAMAQCSRAGSKYDPLDAMSNRNYSRECNSRRPLHCALGDLSSKHGQLSLPILGRKKAFFIDTLLPLSGPYSVLHRPITILAAQAGMERLACANLIELLPRKVSASFDMRGVKGLASFSQASPWENTQVTLQLAGLNGRASRYHIHEYPVPPLSTSTAPDPCTADGVGGHWNPFQQPFPAVLSDGQVITDDLFEVGDLSGRQSNLFRRDSVDVSFTDSNIPLYGPYSVIGRSVVLHSSSTGLPPWVCATIGYPKSSRRSAYARLLSPFAGFVHFRQVDHHETTVIVDLHRVDGVEQTTAHRWYIHNKQTENDEFEDNFLRRCQSAGARYNPFNVAIQPSYQCSTDSQQQCALGDLSGKSSSLDMPARGRNKFVYTDSFLPLEGPYSVVSRSVVIYASQGSDQRLACAGIKLYSMQRSQATFASAGVSGFISFRQKSPLEATAVQLQLSGLEGDVSQYNIHQYPVQQLDRTPSASAGHCSADILGASFNPMVVNPRAISMTSLLTSADMYAVGDLSGKFGSLSELTGVISSFIDERYLPMSGPSSIVGRSLALQHSIDNTNWVCANVEPVSGIMIRALAKFNGVLSGDVTLTQVDGFPTTVRLKLRHQISRVSSANHKWYIGTNPVQGNGQDHVGSQCSSAGLHYNPAKVNATAQQYAQRCSDATPLACELGDMSAKHTTLDLPGLGQPFVQVFLADDFLPLSGPFSVVGRSIVINSANGGNGWFACAIIQRQ